MSNLKDIIKKNAAVAAWLKKKNIAKAKKTIHDNVERYENAFQNNTTCFPEIADPLRYRREIIIGAHILEKGLSHTDFRPGFGKAAIIDLQNSIQLYMKTDDPDQFALSNAVSLLKQYHELNASYGFDDTEYVKTELFANFEHKDLSPYSIMPEAFDTMSFSELAHKRHSVRSYDGYGLELSDEEIIDVITLANTAPSACNRQATHVFVVKDKDMMQKLETLHGGCKNFGARASAFMLITSDLSLYSRNEVKIPSYDAGIYSMNLLYALQSKGIYSCILNGSFPGDAYKKVHELTSIPERYDVSGLIAVYKLDSTENIRIAASPRRDAEDVVTIL